VFDFYNFRKHFTLPLSLESTSHYRSQCFYAKLQTLAIKTVVLLKFEIFQVCYYRLKLGRFLTRKFKSLMSSHSFR